MDITAFSTFSDGGTADKCFNLSNEDVEFDDKSGEASSLLNVFIAETFALTVERSPKNKVIFSIRVCFVKNEEFLHVHFEYSYQEVNLDAKSMHSALKF